MTISYHDIAGRSLERLAALSDGIFAVAMTLLVLDLRVPVNEGLAGQSTQVLWAALVVLAPRLVTYLMSFLTLGIFWLGQQTQFTYIERSNRNLAWIHLLFLAGVSLLPFSTALLSEFITYWLAVVIYWLNVLFLGLMVLASWFYARSAHLIREEVTPAISNALIRRIVVYQGLYTFAMLLCVINTTLSIGLLVFFQLNAVVSPRRFFDRFLGASAREG